ncbi:MAG: penicillin-binding protein 2 [Candidatus Magasanikbacteria bacterium RIFCSPHIGHO2_01_FULL_33_34]|uniref:Penicillin-binding protein 2 n=1 Tax=Candidatus Magasanikbacteria bacterium RIFCSPHIGHO2_01_FULL_33_34 TaxID=1798671 RepID=A0A1F6LLC7_9BACT|nr:MAG: penicillin-binding protein 2 [Candidatus Magasanikbacteria bacterium RIFCSPHIGHO2_01_FULL_33_34]OGH65864.1 MAG: penicillin-binding protein 2 [Candidatus Magasanikbacteria bacterium RIFCSPHIGHO2_02_FULL_33_17]OGH75229.1 MAG: penicillin-binding protein 2 [Candidatus Magasanikbacteria bacterium RIFCSPLOWO2_01_FULL_33_34]OGH81864.1 MAG: penicillin-binding protein 2 [Candidatus Magasanikbacteria bacterium RIFCSPLOWO2_12_FULL_34_7]
MKSSIFKKFTGKIFSNNSIYNAYDDSVIFETASGKQIATPIGKTHIGTNFTKKKANLFIFFVIATVFIIVARLYYLQIFQGSQYLNIAKGNREKKIPIVSERGHILDRNGVQLTENIPNFSLALTPSELPDNKADLDKVVSKLAVITSSTESDIFDTLNEFSDYLYESIIIKEDLDYDTALSIQIKSADLPGLYIQRGSKRLYTYVNLDERSSMAHIIGYLGKLDRKQLDAFYELGYLPSDIAGQTGIEKQYEKLLRGVYGEIVYEVDALGHEQNVLSETAPKSGDHIKLTIDLNIQKKLEEILQKNLDANKKKRGSAVVMNPKNGEILALVSLPTYNNNDFSGGIDFETYKKYTEDKDNPLFNRAVAGSYPSGSTIKPAIAVSALEDGIITKNTSFLSVGGISVDPWFFPDWQAGGHGRTNVRYSLAWSVNTFYYYIGGGYENFTGLGIDKIKEYLNLFGFGKKLGIDLPGENSGFLPSKEWKEEVKKEKWYIGDTYNVSIGQGDVLVTPLQIASMTATIANGGTFYKPKLLKSIVDSDYLEEKTQEKEIILKDFIQKDHLKTVREGMRDCVVYGSCRRLASSPIETAGKTGTAQWSSNNDPHSWYTSFAPYDDPSVVLTVLIEEGAGESSSAVPVADEFYRWWYYY